MRPRQPWPTRGPAQLPLQLRAQHLVPSVAIASRPAVNTFCTASEVNARAILWCEDGHPTATSRGAYSAGQVLCATVAVAPDPDYALVPTFCYAGGLTDTESLVRSSRSSPPFKTLVSRCYSVAASCLVAVVINSCFRLQPLSYPQRCCMQPHKLLLLSKPQQLCISLGVKRSSKSDRLSLSCCRRL